MDTIRVRKQYNRAARVYDRFSDVVLNGLLHAEQYREHAIDCLGNIRGARVLDVGCGTGRSFPLLQERVGENGRIIGLDVSEEMLRIAARRIRERNIRNADLVRGDATTLEGVSSCVDAVLSVWCYGQVDDLNSALSRAMELLRPDGRISIMVFDRAKPDRGLLRMLYPVYRPLLAGLRLSSSNDVHNDAMKIKWRSGREILRAGLSDFASERYVGGTLSIISGRKRRAAN